MQKYAIEVNESNFDWAVTLVEPMWRNVGVDRMKDYIIIVNETVVTTVGSDDREILAVQNVCVKRDIFDLTYTFDTGGSDILPVRISRRPPS
jgi:hypothetical protein